MTKNEFLAIYPEFDSEDFNSTIIELELTNATLDIDETIWGDRAATGLAALAAHRIAIRKMSADAGGVLRGDVVSSYADGVGIEFKGKYKDTVATSPMNLTHYGQRYLELEKIVAYTVARQSIGSL